MEGQKHKKKAASQTSDTKKLPKGTFKCELCDVICTGRDAFAAHVKGASHTKVTKRKFHYFSFIAFFKPLACSCKVAILKFLYKEIEYRN